MLAFVHVEKAAGTTLTRILRQTFGLAHCDVRSFTTGWRAEDDCFRAEDLRRTQLLYPLLASIAGHGVKPWLDLADVPGMRFHTLVREPLARCASHYQHQVRVMRKHVRVEDWLREPLYRNFTCRKLCGGESAADAIGVVRARLRVVGLVDRFDEYLLFLRRAFPEVGWDMRYVPVNVARHAGIREQLLSDPRTRAALADANREDAELHRWVREEYYPEQVRAYGPTLARDLGALRAANRRPPGRVRQLPSLLLRHLVYVPWVKAVSTMRGART